MPGIETTQQLNTSVVYPKGSENSFLLMVTKGYEDEIEQLKNEIKTYQDCLKNLHEDITLVANNCRKRFVTVITNFSS